MPKRIFIVDDSKIVRELVRGYLESRLDYISFAEAVDGLDAIQRAREVEPDLIILDLCMPYLNGLETAAALHGMLPRVPIVLYTLHKDVISETRVRVFGISSVVSKMDQIEVLLEETLKYVGVAKAASA
jgi:two-component system, NarL family, response regulator EvgA